jgi:hypothetical protein
MHSVQQFFGIFERTISSKGVAVHLPDFAESCQPTFHYPDGVGKKVTSFGDYSVTLSVYLPMKLTTTFGIYSAYYQGWLSNDCNVIQPERRGAQAFATIDEAARHIADADATNTTDCTVQDGCYVAEL